MSQDKRLKDLARRAYISYHQDGIIDILLGIGILGFGLMLVTGSVVFNILAWMPVIFYVPLKNRITVPRFGYVQFTSEQKKRKHLWLALAAGVVALAFFLGLFLFMVSGYMPAGLERAVGRFDILLIAVLLAVPMIAGGLLTGLKRLIGYAIMVLAVIGIGTVLGVDLPFLVVVLGSVILMVGIVLLVRFLRQYPLEDEGLGKNHHG